MLYTHFAEKSLGLQGVKITNIESIENSIVIYAELEKSRTTVLVAMSHLKRRCT